MNIYALSSLLASYVFFVAGIFIYQRDPKNDLNRIYMLTCMLLGCLAVLEFGLRQSADAATAHMIFRMGSFWPFAISIYMHFVLIFTEKERALQSKITYFLLYVPACIFSVLDLTTNTLTGEPTKEYWGWTYILPENTLVYNINTLWFALLTVLPIILCFLYFRRAEDAIKRRRAKYVCVGMLIPAVVGLATEGILLVSNVRVPDITLVASTIEVAIITYGIYKYNIFELTPAVAADDIVAAMSNMLFLTRKNGDISLTNERAVTLLGYNENELIGQPLQKIFAEKEGEPIQSLIDSHQFISNREMDVLTKDGRIIPVLVSISVVRDKDQTNLGMVCIGSDLTDHQQAEEAKRKEVLLKEIHHRVKNNMQIISSLLHLQCGYVTDEQYKEMFKDCENRIQSMALLHERLYQSKDLENINAHEYIADIVYGLTQSYGGQGITLTMDVDDITVGIDTAIPCGLIINELVSNALKHAFPDKKGEITVRFSTINGTIALVITDNGVGIPDTIDFRTRKTLGLHLVTILAEDQLDGHINLVKDKGTEFYITFKNR